MNAIEFVKAYENSTTHVDLTSRMIKEKIDNLQSSLFQLTSLLQIDSADTIEELDLLFQNLDSLNNSDFNLNNIYTESVHPL